MKEFVPPKTHFFGVFTYILYNIIVPPRELFSPDTFIPMIIYIGLQMFLQRKRPATKSSNKSRYRLCPLALISTRSNFLSMLDHAAVLLTNRQCVLTLLKTRSGLMVRDEKERLVNSFACKQARQSHFP